MRRLAIALSALVVLGAGWYGSWSYGHDYYLYRGFGPPREAAGIPRGRLVSFKFWSPALHARKTVLVYLPHGYFQGVQEGRRYPAMYLLQSSVGQAKNFILVGALNVVVDTLLNEHRIPPFLVVMPGGHGPDDEWANAGAGNWDSYVIDVVHAVDRRFATFANRRDRAIAGLSEGAFGATNVALRHPDVFATFESWSGYYTQMPVFPFNHASRAQIAANSPAVYVPREHALLHRYPMRAFLYDGTLERAQWFPKYRAWPVTLAFGRELRAAGADVTTALFPGRHNWRLWRHHLPQMLVFAGKGFSR